MRIIHFDAGVWRERFDDGFNRDNVARVADALGSVWALAAPGATVLVGYDTRREAMEHALVAGGVIAAHDLRVVVSASPLPTPALSWSAAQDPSCVGAVMITATDRPADWGGILVRGSDGGPVAAEVLAAVTHAIDGAIPHDVGPVGRGDLIGPYLKTLLRNVDGAAIADAAPLVVADSMYGASSAILGKVLAAAGATVISMHDHAEPGSAGLSPLPIEPWVDACEQRVRASGARCGVVVNGDGSRAALIDERGAIVPPQYLIPLLLAHIASRSASVGKRVVATMATSALVSRQALLLGREVTAVPVGFDRLYDEVREGDVLLATDEYGGLCLPEHLHERDGLLVGLLAIELASTDEAPVSTRVADLEREVGHVSYGRRDIKLDPARIQALRNILPGLNPERVAGRAPVAVSHADGLYLRFDDDAWMMLRPARTQAAVRAYAEAPSLQQRDELLEAAHQLTMSHL